MLLFLAFWLFLSFCLCAWRVCFGPQTRLAWVGLCGGFLGFALVFCADLTGVQAPLYMAAASAVVMQAMALLMAVTSVLHWWRTPDPESSSGEQDSAS